MNWKKHINPFLIVMLSAIIIPSIITEYKETGTFPIEKLIMQTILFLLGRGDIPTKLTSGKESEQKKNRVLELEHQENVGDNMTVKDKHSHTESHSTVINNFNGNIINSQFQQGNDNIMNAKKGDTEIEMAKSLLAELKKITENLSSDDQKAVLQADIETIESQMKSPTTKIGFIKEIFKSVRNILEGSVGSTLATTYPSIDELFKKLLDR